MRRLCWVVIWASLCGSTCISLRDDESAFRSFRVQVCFISLHLLTLTFTP